MEEEERRVVFFLEEGRVLGGVFFSQEASCRVMGHICRFVVSCSSEDLGVGGWKLEVFSRPAHTKYSSGEACE